MIANVILEEKWRTQERMSEKVGHDLKKYLENIDNIVRKMEKEKGARFKYAKIQDPCFPWIILACIIFLTGNRIF